MGMYKLMWGRSAYTSGLLTWFRSPIHMMVYTDDAPNESVYEWLPVNQMHWVYTHDKDSESKAMQK